VVNYQKINTICIILFLMRWILKRRKGVKVVFLTGPPFSGRVAPLVCLPLPADSAFSALALALPAKQPAAATAGKAD